MFAKQRGMTFLGMLIVAVIALSLLLAGIKIVPNYIEFFSVKKTLKSVSSKDNFNSMTNAEIITSFDKSANVNYITVVNGRDLIFSSDANGKKVISVQYEVVEPLAFNLSALMDFKASSAK
jgi:hypothetical protein